MVQWQTQIQNDFEEAVLAHYPQIRQLKNALIDAGADYVSLSGSGSAVFALSKEPLKAGKINNTPLLSHGKL
jgi:4-diphosphocytidyl-2-C-methyl-D-erythritol kinase